MLICQHRSIGNSGDMIDTVKRKYIDSCILNNFEVLYSHIRNKHSIMFTDVLYQHLCIQWFTCIEWFILKNCINKFNNVYWCIVFYIFDSVCWFIVSTIILMVLNDILYQHLLFNVLMNTMPIWNTLGNVQILYVIK